jgi:hypothetical protein
MVILTPIQKLSKFFLGKGRAHICPDLPLENSSNKYGRRPWCADMRVERDGLSYRCLPYYLRWTNWASVKYVKKKKTCRVSLSIGVRITMICCVVYLLRIFKMFHGLWNTLYNHSAKVRQSEFVLVAEQKQSISLYKRITTATSATMDGRSDWGVKWNVYKARMTDHN